MRKEPSPEDMKVVELRAELKKRGLSPAGLKVDLIERLSTARKKEAPEVPETANEPVTDAKSLQDLKKIIKSTTKMALTSLAASELSEFQRQLEHSCSKIVSHLMCEKKNKAFALKAQKLKTERFGQLLNGITCVHCDYERADYHVTHSCTWEIRLPKPEQDDNSIRFSCSFSGDNEGSGSYSWCCSHASFEYSYDRSRSHCPHYLQKRSM